MPRLWLGLAVVAITSALTSGCIGSNAPYRPYKGEERPDQEVKVDPLVAEVELKYALSHEVHENTTYIQQSRKDVGAVLERVHKNKDGSPRNAWYSYEDDMIGTLGPGTLKRIGPRPQAKPDRPTPKKEEGEGDKPAPAEGEKKEGEGGEKKEGEGG